MKLRAKGVAYIDDLREVMTRDWKLIKPRLLYRSANLAKVPDGGQKLYDKFHIRYVIDLRTDDEVAAKPETLIPEIQYFHIPIADNAENPIVTKENRLAFLKELSARPGGTREYMRQFYPLLINSPKAIEGYKKIFNILLSAQKDEAVLFHCTQGKDRTGIVLLLILSALNVDNHVIIRKYMEYNIINWLFKASVRVAMSLFKSPRLASQLDNVISARRIYIKSAIYEIINKYDGAENYLRNIIGITDNDIKLLRLKYLR